MAVTTAFADSPRNGAWGDRPYALVDLAGPASYTQVTNGATPSGGQTIDNTLWGLGTNVEGVVPVGASTTGAYEVVAIQVPFLAGQPVKNWTLRWKVSATGAEVAGSTNLSTELIRLLAFGPY